MKFCGRLGQSCGSKICEGGCVGGFPFPDENCLCLSSSPGTACVDASVCASENLGDGATEISGLSNSSPEMLGHELGNE